MPRALPAPRRGGRRPGAGGKPGNLNALKHGRRSAQLAHLGFILATIPEAKQALLHLAARHRLKQRKAEQVAVLLLNKMMERAPQWPNVKPSIETKPRLPSLRFAPSPQEKFHPPNYQTPNLSAPNPSKTRYGKPIDPTSKTVDRPQVLGSGGPPYSSSSSNALCSARTAAGTCASSIRQVIRISLVVISSMLIPASYSVWNIRPA